MPNAMLRGILWVAVAFGVSACGGSAPTPPTAPSAPQAAPLPSFTGIWETEYRVLSCGGNRPWHCPATGSLVPLTLRLEEIGDTVSGYILEQPRGMSPVSGRISNRTANLQGGTVRVTFLQATLEAREMSLYHAPDGGMVGSLNLIYETHSIYLDIRGEIVTTLRHSPLPNITDYSGTWRGSYIGRSCVSDSRPSCRARQSVGATETFELVVDVAQKTLRLGTLAPWPVFGTTGASGLNLHPQEFQNTDELFTITRFSAVRNRVGQLQGTFTYVLRNPVGSTVETETADFELLNVVQVR